ncbi:MAG: ferredoxin III, nif-specific [Hydrogenothermaceae bacterium]|nr:ferredoxin III, nif-specific [Hydrogenothermaceae bacterium]
MALVKSYKKSGEEYIPKYIFSLNKEECIACGRCYRSCPMDVFELFIEEDEDGEEIKYMTITNDNECIGCGTCNKVCPKNCLTHKPLEIGR